MKKNTKDSIVIGFALFSMFFGAGNLIFPGFLGNELGSSFFIGMIGFILTGVGLPLLAIIACSKGDGSFESIAAKIGPKFVVIFTSILFIAIGPLLAVPRTAAITFEMSIQPLLPSMSNKTFALVSILAIALYFSINLYFVLKKSSIVDTIGKLLTPALILLLTLIIVKGIFMPIGTVVDTEVSNVLSISLLDGYQTMDALAALLFAAIITTSLKDKGYKKEDMPSMILKSSLVAAIGLAFIYGGLMFIGAQTSSIEACSSLDQPALLAFMAKSILGSTGPVIIGIAVGLACLSTSIGLVTAGANFFEKITKGKLSYKLNAIVISIISFAIALLGVKTIVAFSGTVLELLYPVSITIIITTLLSKYIKNVKAIRYGVYTSLFLSIMQILPGIDTSFLPLSSVGFAWVLPTILAVLIGSLKLNSNRENNSNEELAY